MTLHTSCTLTWDCLDLENRRHIIVDLMVDIDYADPRTSEPRQSRVDERLRWVTCTLVDEPQEKGPQVIPDVFIGPDVAGHDFFFDLDVHANIG